MMEKEIANVYAPFKTAYVSVPEFAEVTGLPQAYVRALCRERILSTVRMGASKCMINTVKARSALERLESEQKIVYADARSALGLNNNPKKRPPTPRRRSTSTSNDSKTDITRLQAEAVKAAG